MGVLRAGSAVRHHTACSSRRSAPRQKAADSQRRGWALEPALAEFSAVAEPLGETG